MMSGPGEDPAAAPTAPPTSVRSSSRSSTVQLSHDVPQSAASDQLVASSGPRAAGQGRVGHGQGRGPGNGSNTRSGHLIKTEPRYPASRDGDQAAHAAATREESMPQPSGGVCAMGSDLSAAHHPSSHGGGQPQVAMDGLQVFVTHGSTDVGCQVCLPVPPDYPRLSAALARPASPAVDPPRPAGSSMDDVQPEPSRKRPADWELEPMHLLAMAAAEEPWDEGEPPSPQRSSAGGSAPSSPAPPPRTAAETAAAAAAAAVAWDGPRGPQLGAGYHYARRTTPPPATSSLGGGGFAMEDDADVQLMVTATPKRARLAWTPELHAKFVKVVTKLGASSAVPKAILNMMGVKGLTREQVASHLQKYRLHLKRGTTQAVSASWASQPASGGGGGGGGGTPPPPDRRTLLQAAALNKQASVPRHLLLARGFTGCARVEASAESSGGGGDGGATGAARKGAAATAAAAVAAAATQGRASTSGAPGPANPPDAAAAAAAGRSMVAMYTRSMPLRGTWAAEAEQGGGAANACPSPSLAARPATPPAPIKLAPSSAPVPEQPAGGRVVVKTEPTDMAMPGQGGTDTSRADTALASFTHGRAAAGGHPHPAPAAPTAAGVEEPTRTSQGGCSASAQRLSACRSSGDKGMGAGAAVGLSAVPVLDLGRAREGGSTAADGGAGKRVQAAAPPGQRLAPIMLTVQAPEAAPHSSGSGQEWVASVPGGMHVAMHHAPAGLPLAGGTMHHHHHLHHQMAGGGARYGPVHAGSHPMLATLPTGLQYVVSGPGGIPHGLAMAQHSQPMYVLTAAPGSMGGHRMLTTAPGGLVSTHGHIMLQGGHGPAGMGGLTLVHAPPGAMQGSAPG